MLDEREMSALRTPKGSTGIGHAEIEAQATYDKDQIESARTGKKQVLKVGFGPKTSAHTIAEEFWFHVNAGVQLYSNGYVGRCTCVSVAQSLTFEAQ